MYLNCLCFMFVCGLYVFCKFNKHLLLVLLSLEYLVLVLFFVLFVSFMLNGDSGYFLLFFLIFGVCEGVLGLSLMVAIIRCHGNDNMMAMSMLSW